MNIRQWDNSIIVSVFFNTKIDLKTYNSFKEKKLTWEIYYNIII